MAKLGKRSGRSQPGKGHRTGPGNKARGGVGGGSRPGVARHDQQQPKGPSRTIAKEDNAKKKRAEERRRRFDRSMPREVQTHAQEEAFEDEPMDASECGSDSEGGDSEQEEGPHSSYNRLMQVLKKNVAESDEDEDEQDEDEEEESDGEDDEEDDEEEEGELEWEEVSSNDEEEAEAEGDEDEDEEDDEDDDAEELEGAGPRSKGARSAQSREDDPEADRDELGLDADAPESDDEQEDEEEPTTTAGKKSGKPGATDAAAATAGTEAKGGFAKYFDVTISTEEAEEAEKLRAGGKWKKQEALVEAVPAMLWRKGCVGARALPAPAAEDARLEDVCGAGKGVAELFKIVAENAAKKNKADADESR
jgi:hypothetical protein